MNTKLAKFNNALLDFEITSISSGDNDDDICIMPSNAMSDSESMTDNES